jgi:hypothetical protein
MALVHCPKCGELVKQEGFEVWQYIVSICLYPIGLLSLLAGRKPSVCYKCDTIFETKISSTGVTVAIVFGLIYVIGGIGSLIGGLLAP